MKNLLAVLMCFQFMVAPVVSSSKAWAEEMSEEEKERLAKEQADEAEKAAKEASDKAAADAKSGQNKYREGGEDAGKGDEFYVQQALILTTSCIGANILVSCAVGYMQLSLYGFMIGSFVHIAAEIFGAKAVNKHHERSAKNIAFKEEELKKAVGDGSLQRETVKMMLEEEKNTKKFVEDRKKWIEAVEIIYWISMGLAIAEILAEWGGVSSFGGCAPVIPLYMGTAMAISAAYGYSMSATSDSWAMKIGTPIASVIGSIGVVGEAVAWTYNHAIPRAIAFGAHAGAAKFIKDEMGKKIEEIDKNIKKLEALLESFKEEIDDSPAVATPTTTDENKPNATGGKYNGTENDKEVTELPKHCGSSGNGKGTTYSEDCSKPLKFSPTNVNTDFVPPPLLEGLNKTTDLGNATSEGDRNKIAVALGDHNAGAARMRGLVEKMQSELNAKLKKAGKKEIDFKGEMKKKMDSMVADFNKANKGGGSLGASGAKATLDAPATSTASAANGPTGALGKPVAKAKGAVNPLTGLGDGSAAMDAPAAAPENSQTLSDSLSEFESSENDINKQSEVSIFALISNRYVLNYGKVMKKKEAPVEEAAAPKEETPPKK